MVHSAMPKEVWLKPKGIPEPITQFIPAQQVREAIARPGSRVWVATEKMTVRYVGIGLVHSIDKVELEERIADPDIFRQVHPYLGDKASTAKILVIDHLVVDEKRRRTGVGRQLLREAENDFRRNHGHVVIAPVSPEADEFMKPFFEGADFTHVGIFPSGPWQGFALYIKHLS